MPCPEECTFLSGIEGVEEADVGQRIGSGAQHIVYAYGQDKVVKVPWRDARPTSLWGFCVAPHVTPTYEKMAEDIFVCTKYFGDKVVPTKIFCHTREAAAYALTQPKIDMRDYVPGDEQNPKLSRQLREIVRINAIMRHERKEWLDVMGCRFNFPFVPPYLANAAVIRSEDGSENMGLHDITLYSEGHYRSLRGIVDAVSLAVNQWQVRRLNAKLRM